MARSENYISGNRNLKKSILVLILICFGSVMVFSASYAYALSSRGDSYYFIKKQILFVVIGVIAMIVIANAVDYKIIKYFSRLYFGVVFIMLVGVLAFGIAEGEAQRWVTIPYIDFTIPHKSDGTQKIYFSASTLFSFSLHH